MRQLIFLKRYQGQKLKADRACTMKDLSMIGAGELFLTKISESDV